MDTDTTKVESSAESNFEREKKGLIADLAKQREKNRMLEERLNVIEASLSEPEQNQVPVNEKVNLLAQDPDTYIMNLVNPALDRRVRPIENGFTQSQVNTQIEDAMEEIAEKEGISKREAKKRYDEKLSVIVSERGFGSLPPKTGILSAYDIMKTETKKKEEKEKERESVINGNATETVRTSERSSSTKWTTSRIRKVQEEGQWEKYREEILEAQRRGLIVRDS